eukprot:scaffold102150_cov63-Phaeocystis_antarctica.AAC.1
MSTMSSPPPTIWPRESGVPSNSARLASATQRATTRPSTQRHAPSGSTRRAVRSHAPLLASPTPPRSASGSAPRALPVPAAAAATCSAWRTGMPPGFAGVAAGDGSSLGRPASPSSAAADWVSAPGPQPRPGTQGDCAAAVRRNSATRSTLKRACAAWAASIVASSLGGDGSATVEESEEEEAAAAEAAEAARPREKRAAGASRSSVAPSACSSRSTAEATRATTSPSACPPPRTFVRRCEACAPSTAAKPRAPSVACVSAACCAAPPQPGSSSAATRTASAHTRSAPPAAAAAAAVSAGPAKSPASSARSLTLARLAAPKPKQAAAAAEKRSEPSAQAAARAAAEERGGAQPMSQRAVATESGASSRLLACIAEAHSPPGRCSSASTASLGEVSQPSSQPSSTPAARPASGPMGDSPDAGPLTRGTRAPAAPCARFGTGAPPGPRPTDDVLALDQSRLHSLDAFTWMLSHLLASERPCSSALAPRVRGVRGRRALPLRWTGGGKSRRRWERDRTSAAAFVRFWSAREGAAGVTAKATAAVGTGR